MAGVNIRDLNMCFNTHTQYIIETLGFALAALCLFRYICVTGRFFSYFYMIFLHFTEYLIVTGYERRLMY